MTRTAPRTACANLTPVSLRRNADGPSSESGSLRCDQWFGTSPLQFTSAGEQDSPETLFPNGPESVPSPLSSQSRTLLGDVASPGDPPRSPSRRLSSHVFCRRFSRPAKCRSLLREPGDHSPSGSTKGTGSRDLESSFRQRSRIRSSHFACKAGNRRFVRCTSCRAMPSSYEVSYDSPSPECLPPDVCRRDLANRRRGSPCLLL